MSDTVRPLEVLRLGRLGYTEAHRFMERRVEARKTGDVPDALLLVEHPPVVTLGRRGDRTHILAPPSLLADQGVEVVETGRGGDVTYHGPGQVVGYPVISLSPERKDVKRYVADLEEVMIDICESYGLQAGRSQGQIGCWLQGERKIGAIGVRISKWVTSHGFAFNVAPDMSHFGLIVPCGISDRKVTALSLELEETPPLDEVFERAAEAFVRRFGHRPH